MIVDKKSDMCDYSLRTNINKRVRVVLCHTQSDVNPQYFNLVKATKGIVHTLNEDWDEIFKMKQGSKFQMLENVYQVRAGQIELVGPQKQ